MKRIIYTILIFLAFQLNSKKAICQIDFEYGGIHYVCSNYDIYESEIDLVVVELESCVGYINEVIVHPGGGNNSPGGGTITLPPGSYSNGSGSSDQGSGGGTGGSAGTGGSNNGSDTEDHPDPSTPPTSPKGDPIDPITGLPNVTERFNDEIKKAFQHFCGSTFTFQNKIDNYGNLLNGIIDFPQDYIDYMMDFYNDVRTGGPWDLKYYGHGYSEADLGIGVTQAIYNGEIMHFDDFGNITFGIAAAAYGLPMQFAQTGAGFYQLLSGTSSWSYIYSYWDDPRDSEMIQIGYLLFYSKGGCWGDFMDQ